MLLRHAAAGVAEQQWGCDSNPMRHGRCGECIQQQQPSRAACGSALAAPHSRLQDRACHQSGCLSAGHVGRAFARYTHALTLRISDMPAYNAEPGYCFWGMANVNGAKSASIHDIMLSYYSSSRNSSKSMTAAAAVGALHRTS